VTTRSGFSVAPPVYLRWMAPSRVRTSLQVSASMIRHAGGASEPGLVTITVLPCSYLARDRFDSVANLKAFSKPVAVLLAEKDEVIPISHGQRLYDSLTTKKQRWVFPGAGHNTWPSGKKEPWWDEVVKFFSQEHV